MGGASRRPGISWSSTWLATGGVSQAHKSASRDERAYRETAFVSLRTVSNRCNTAERTRQHAGRKTVSQPESVGESKCFSTSRRQQIITTRRLEAGSRLHHHPSPPCLLSLKMMFLQHLCHFSGSVGTLQVSNLFFFKHLGCILFSPPFSPTHNGRFHAKTLLLLHIPCKINAAPSVGRENCTAALIHSQVFKCF